MIEHDRLVAVAADGEARSSYLEAPIPKRLARRRPQARSSPEAL